MEGIKKHRLEDKLGVNIEVEAINHALKTLYPQSAIQAEDGSDETLPSKTLHQMLQLLDGACKLAKEQGQDPVTTEHVTQYHRKTQPVTRAELRARRRQHVAAADERKENAA
jgi:hypothetical protein